jgi:mannitol/fructose-specific phosphotransferase system IIA component (Ntr-type)
MKLANLITTDRILPEMKAADQPSAIVELVDHLVLRGLLPPAQRDGTVDALLAREEQVSTGIGSGVAIPHAFSDDLDEVVAVFGRSQAGIDFEAIDQAPVHLIILFIVPRKDYHLHLRTLAAIAKMFTNSDVRRRLTGASTREEMLDILHAKPSRPPIANA